METKIVGVIAILALCLVSVDAPAKTKKTIRRVQEVNFDEMSLKGTIRNPDGAYLVQKRGLKFLPLHDVKKDMDSRIRESSFYVK
ncbi:MAG: hypothetical protein KF802_14890 [Bdellovibrionaceae bacterium]|nr:hypothetical protein [Pseudobdellovibrionaceae bacterium]MBX3035148.1 hypothetical protein [Pseudobdellovibrionaceae bacterium]